MRQNHTPDQKSSSRQNRSLDQKTSSQESTENWTNFAVNVVAKDTTKVSGGFGKFQIWLAAF